MKEFTQKNIDDLKCDNRKSPLLCKAVKEAIIEKIPNASKNTRQKK